MTNKQPDKAKKSLKNEECYYDLLQGKLQPISFKVDVEIPNQESCLVFILKFHFSIILLLLKLIDKGNFDKFLQQNISLKGSKSNLNMQIANEQDLRTEKD